MPKFLAQPALVAVPTVLFHAPYFPVAELVLICCLMVLLAAVTYMHTRYIDSELALLKSSAKYCSVAFRGVGEVFRHTPKTAYHDAKNLLDWAIIKVNRVMEV